MPIPPLHLRGNLSLGSRYARTRLIYNYSQEICLMDDGACEKMIIFRYGHALLSPMPPPRAPRLSMASTDTAVFQLSIYLRFFDGSVLPLSERAKALMSFSYTEMHKCAGIPLDARMIFLLAESRTARVSRRARASPSRH